MTLFDLVDEVFEKTHVDRAEILERALKAWPRVQDFTITQCRLLERALKGAENGHSTGR